MSERAVPRPNGIDEAERGTIEFGRLGRCFVEGRFEGGSMTSGDGVMLLVAADRKLGPMEAASHCIADPRFSVINLDMRSNSHLVQ